MSSSTARPSGRAAARPAVRHVCRECRAEAPRWVGRCPQCQVWGSVEVQVGARAAPAGRPAVPARPIAEVDPDDARCRPTGLPELDRVLGGGLVPGGVVLLTGEPGVGKSTLLLSVAARVATSGRRALLVTGEESASQVRARAGRVGALAADLWLAAETDLCAVLDHVEQVRPDLLVVDSVQTISAAVEGAPGGVSQVREVAGALVTAAKRSGMSTVLVGHVTKDGSLAGPRSLEHVVDVVLHVEGDRGSPLRLVRAVKNRFGPTDELGCLEMCGDGFRDLPDPSGLFLSRTAGAEVAPGTCVTVAQEGRRSLVVEVQALVAKTSATIPRRTVSGLDPARLAMVLAVVDTRAGVRVCDCDVYAATVGGVRVVEPAADLAMALAVASARHDVALPPDLVALGEVGLAGDVRRTTAVERRLAAAGRLGFRRAIVPVGTGAPPPGVRAVEVANLRQAVTAVADLARMA